MKRDKWRGHVVTCAFLSSLCAGFSYAGYRQNSWGKWRKSTALSNCLPLPPPIGCAELYNSREVLNDEDTDFSVLCLVNCFVFLANTILAMSVLAGEGDTVFGMEKRFAKKSVFLSFLVAAIIGILTCLIAAFRINVLATLQRRQGIFAVSGLNPVYSISFYLTALTSLLTLFGAYVANHICLEDDWSSKRLSKTVKQHMARNLMYPDDKRSTKMVTFSSMPPDMEEAAARISVQAVMKYGLEEDIAEHIKLDFEALYGATWHCAVGANFGSAIHHRTNEYVEVAMPQLSVVLFRCDEPPSRLQNLLSIAAPSH